MNVEPLKTNKEYDSNEIRYIKDYILRYFSTELQYDESITGAMERKQLQKWLINWAKK